ncbi:alpha-1,3-mannosyl-glycoprotein 2-beta-N-acetylglucosaminyltransferase-like isoform X2 [Polyodon spathula]|nr:alpha-1,3-mannosyl-glycoprotein 2-beta-N-acetylglucosaminyltransferase-like isoform X2 [Polyodon spathula]XP_041091425.1 alpha-1,3-mannosyl-glycoprotein 2-beta-N-acetylglucosaminyltransferase-like isoform X2 [Polyodon spathula]XP_041091426.1 alpha-1,3-mannosyl-glycoprotein 2-beta-N-acetylglucosaminyltransferase-like isoform X2 [Polyodon spathula]XP_041091427.1 alpha-1,3-mannosyl-glycoprotein 2-beta-N-acetylglucosaminyltransferase-like isoform X2 [Polyodon spathula]XP_041091428.1 alpha-1,3-ma
MVRRASLILCGVVLFIAWNALLLLFLWWWPPIGSPGTGGGVEPGEGREWDGDLTRNVVQLAEEVEAELEKQKQLLQQIQSHRALWEKKKNNNQIKEKQPVELNNNNNEAGAREPETAALQKIPDVKDIVIAVLVVACDRPTVRRSLDKLLYYRPSKELFPIIVSQDCGHEETAKVIGSYGDQVMHLRQPDLSSIRVRADHRKFQGYYKISRHYRWALNQVFHTFKYQVAVIVEDDLEVAPDFFEYFRSLFPLLLEDKTLWCVSAWNDNGREQMIDPKAPELLYRTDFFPGLGWMLLKELWEELEPKWPASFWDDWIRQPGQRKERACVRPEISRTMTFGRKGVSMGQFYDQYLRFIKLNDQFVPFTQRDLAFLKKEAYDRTFAESVYTAPTVRVEELHANKVTVPGPVRVQYSTKDTFKAFAKALGVMDDLKSGVPRAGYRGVVSFMFRGRRVFLAPPPGWKGYDTTWS